MPPLYVLCRGVGFAYGGVQTAVTCLVDELLTAGIDARLVTRPAGETDDVWCDGPVWTWNRKRLDWWRARVRGFTDLAYVVTPDPWAVLALRQTHPHARVVFTPGELELRPTLKILTNSHAWWGTRYFEWVAARAINDAMRLADSTILASDALRQFASTQRGLDLARLHVAPYGVRIQAQDVASHDLHAELNLDRSVPLIAGVGRHVRRKRFDFLIDGFSRMTSRAAHLVLIGSGEETATLKEHARALGCERVHFLGARNNVDELLRQCTIVVMSSDYEPFGIVVLEGMAARCLVVLRRPKFPEVVIGAAEHLVDGVDSLIVDTEDTGDLGRVLDEALQNRTRTAAIREAGYRRAATDFTWARYARACVELLNYDALRPSREPAPMVQ